VIKDNVLPVVKELLAKYPEGYLIRREDGQPWADNPNRQKKTKRTKLMADRFASLVKATNHWSVKRGGGQVVRPDVTLYSYRHGYVTHWLKEGGDALSLCNMLNTSLEMIQDHYSHLFEEHDARMALSRSAIVI
jgi:integrase